MEGLMQNPDQAEQNEITDEEIDSKICGELMDKVEQLNEYVNDVQGEQIIQVRVQQLALCKVLVNIHKKDMFILVKAYCSLGEAYLSQKYYEQALDHLTNALKLNGTLFSQFEETKKFHAYILTLLGKCYMEAGSLNDALGLLEKSLKMNKTVLGEEDISNASIYLTLSKVYSKKKDYDKALNQLSKAWELTETKFGKDSIEIAQVYIDMAKVYHKKKEYEEAIEHQLHAVNNFRNREEDYNQESTAKMMITLSEWYSKVEKHEDAITWLRETEKLYEYIYGGLDKKTTKIKRDIALLLLKDGKYDDALEEVLQVEEKERQLYGETSLQLGKTYKLIGTLYILRRMQNEAKAYLQKAQTIFELKGATKLLKEVKTKLNMAKNGSRMDHQLAGEEHTDEEESNKKLKKKKKKGVSKSKKKKTIIRNNFMG
ncbi:unnamed protein product [Moneuplotes crassus]|uniref:Tetratricopeptide repeat protein n=1 Tax=Euplotes crassus TaxID=5936 RepID=A0AAD1XCZ2_EUPCR|nr:unnamed protein product [Moneuplotes crassus]